MAYTTINKSTDHFNTKLYTGNGGTNAITGVGFQPDLVWIKDRDATGYHFWTDAVRGVTKTLFSNTTGAEGTEVNGLTAFGTDGFTVGAHSNINTNGRNIVSWNWKAAGGQGSSNTDGSINTTYTSVNTTAGFSISTYSGNGTAGATIGHGLGVVPKMIIVKNKTHAGGNWVVYHESLGNTKAVYLDLTDASGTAGAWNNTSPTSSVFTVNDANALNGSGGRQYVAYCFAEKTGYSKFGSFTGNGNADGTFIYTGFKPSWIMFKRTSAASDWTIFDTKRLTYNVNNLRLEANTTDAEPSGAANKIDILSNGFKMRHSSSSFNNSGGTYIYMAFGQSLVGSNNVPCTAR
jgi:hypothetical protein